MRIGLEHSQPKCPNADLIPIGDCVILIPILSSILSSPCRGSKSSRTLGHNFIMEISAMEIVTAGDKEYNLSPANVLEMRDNLAHELKQLQTAQSIAHQDSEDGDVAELQERVSSLQSQLVKETSRHSLFELTLERAMTSKCLREKLLTDEKRNAHKELVNVEKFPLAAQIVHMTKKSKDLQIQINEQRTKNLELHEETEELMRQMMAAKEKPPPGPEVTQDDEYKMLKSELEINEKAVCYYKNMIPCLVAGLEIDLESDKELAQLVDKCGES